MSMGGPIYHVRTPRAADCDPEFDGFDSGYMCQGCAKWAAGLWAAVHDPKHSERMARLERRAEWLASRVGTRGNDAGDANGHDQAELSALNWAMDLIDLIKAKGQLTR